MIDEPRIHDYGDGGNVHKKVSLEFGDVDEGFAEADLIREDTFFYEGNTHLPMEQHAAVAYFDPIKKLTLWSSTQTPHYVHRALAKVLDIPASHIRVIATPNGGGFGGKSDPFNHEVVVSQTLNDYRPSGEVHADPRRSLLLSSWPPSGPDACQDRCEERRRDHRDAFQVVSRWRRVRQLWRSQHVLHRRFANGDLRGAALQIRRRACIHQQAAVWAEARARHAAAALCAGSSSRQDC